MKVVRRILPESSSSSELESIGKSSMFLGSLIGLGSWNLVCNESQSRESRIVPAILNANIGTLMAGAGTEVLHFEDKCSNF